MRSRWILVVAAVVTAAACSGSNDAPRAVDSTKRSTPSTAVDPTDGSSETVDGSQVPPESEPSTSTDADRGDGGTLDWTACDEQANPLGETECATLEVPLDHGDPDGEQIEIAVARVATAAPQLRIGSLVFNPGGPGGSGIEYLLQAAATVPVEVTQRFDLVGFDPRGVAASTAIECDVQRDGDGDFAVPLLPATDDVAWQALLDESARVSSTCTPDTQRIGPFVGTNNAARDLDLLRAALGDDGLTYVGYSYGTKLGATYAELFPDNVRALVLDAAVKPTTDFDELGAGQATGFDRALENFAAACDADDDCLLREIGPTLDVLAAVRAEIAEIGEFPTDFDGRTLTPGELDLGVVSALYSKTSWPFLAEAIYLAETIQDGTLFQVLTDNYLGREPDGTYTNAQLANHFINCADDAARPVADDVRATNDAVAAASTHFSDLLRADTGCLDLPAPVDPLLVGPASGSAPILVIGNTGDPATPFAWSEELAASLESATLYTVDAEGHTAFGTIDCVADSVTDYLVELVVPAEGASCSDNATADFFVPASETDVGRIIALFDCLRANGVDIPEIGTADVLADPTGESFLEFLDPADAQVSTAIGACSDELVDLQGG